MSSIKKEVPILMCDRPTINGRTPKEVIKKHTCEVDKSCCCYIAGSEPADDCPVHGGGLFPPRCKYCGKFMRWVC